MSMIFRANKHFTNLEKCIEGVWYHPYPDLESEMQFKISHAGEKNPKFKSKQVDNLLDAMGDSKVNLSEKTASDGIKVDVKSFIKKDSELIKIFVEDYLIDWQGIYNVNDELIPYSKEMALKLLLGNMEIASKLMEFSQDPKNFGYPDEKPVNVEKIKKK